MAEFNEYQKKFEDEFFGNKDNQKEVRSKFLAYQKGFQDEWNEKQKFTWEKFTGNFAAIKVPDAYVGINGIGKTSSVWWKTLVAELIEGYRARSDACADEAELQAWAGAIALAEEISNKVEERLEEALERGDWWYRIFESINTQAYKSVEWWAKDWSSHKGWGEEIIAELNKMIREGIITDETEKEFNQANYLKSRTLQSLGKFYRANFNLHLRDIYGNFVSHGWFPVDKEGHIVITYKGKEYKDTSLFEGLNVISDDVKDTTKELMDIWEALDLVNSWYADETTQIKPNNVKKYIKDIGVGKINSMLGILYWFTGHNPLIKLKMPFKTQDGKNAHFHIDKGMAEKFGGQGGYVVIGPEGIKLFGFRFIQSFIVVDSPLTSIVDKKTGKVTTIENPGVERGEFLSNIVEHLEGELKSLDSRQEETNIADGGISVLTVNGREENSFIGIFADVASTMLDILGIEQPIEMTGKSLIVKDNGRTRDESDGG
ncbi:MAG: hypothetical protein KAJ14_02095, partial [Candidatus Omnitrophica bacterium]|nr:hypothetical protein [Candidatus Omnitrophota bacterium]